MDSIISLGQKNTLAEYMILSGATITTLLDKDPSSNEHQTVNCSTSFAVPGVFPSPWDDPIACLNKAMVFLMAVASLRFPSTNNQLRTSSNLRNQATVQDGRVTVQQVQGDKAKIILILLIRAMLLVQGEILQVDKQELLNATTAKDLDTYDSDCDDLSTTQAVLMANISNYGSDVISKVPNSKTYLNDMDNQSVHALQDFEQSPVMDFTDNEISSDNNIIPYSQYLQETQQATVQDVNLQA
ncbi:hypothetical protein Tco_1144414 [Tanacetum coccineum]